MRPLQGGLAEYRRQIGALTTVILTLGAIALIALSPLALQALNNESTDWTALSLIGQSYGAISALLAAIAVIGMMLTLRMQQRQIKDARQIAIRQHHAELLAMAINEPDLLQAWGPTPSPKGLDPRLTTYTNLVLNYFIMLYESESATEKEIRLHLSFMAKGDFIPNYWASTKQVWRTAYPAEPNRIVQMMEEEFERKDTAEG